MQDIKISLITVSFNAGETIEQSIRSVISQKYKNIEYIVVDGGSTDGTLDIINKYYDNISIFLSERDRGIYDAANKGIRLATGDVVGMLNADDVFAGDFVLSDIALAFAQNDTAIVYGDLDYINHGGKIIRKWRSGKYRPGMFNWGWMPPHPTFYCKRELFEKFGYYSLEYGTAADYELMIRLINFHSLSVHYINKVLIKMKTGGISNKSYSNRVKGLIYDLKAMRNNKIPLPGITILLKPLRKIIQYL